MSWTDAADTARRIGRAVEFHPEIGSTNDRARELVEAGEEGVAVVAELQTAGRGRQGRTWLSPSGANLMVSAGIRPALAATNAGLLGATVALAVADACAPWAALRVRWPNDLVTDGGAKVAGLLLETAIAGDEIALAVLGVGINVNWPRSEMPEEIRPYATSLLELAGAPVDRVALLRGLLIALDDGIARLEADSSPVERLRAISWLDGRELEIDTGDGLVGGTGAGVADDGSLLLDTPAGRLALAHGEVRRVRPRDGVTA